MTEQQQLKLYLEEYGTLSIPFIQCKLKMSFQRAQELYKKAMKDQKTRETYRNKRKT